MGRSFGSPRIGRCKSRSRRHDRELEVVLAHLQPVAILHRCHHGRCLLPGCWGSTRWVGSSVHSLTLNQSLRSFLISCCRNRMDSQHSYKDERKEGTLMLSWRKQARIRSTRRGLRPRASSLTSPKGILLALCLLLPQRPYCPGRFLEYSGMSRVVYSCKLQGTIHLINNTSSAQCNGDPL